MELSTIEQAVAAIQRGELVVVVDDEGRENEGDLIMAADLATPEKVAFMVRHTSGVLCVSLPGERLDALSLPLMVQRNEESQATAFTITVDLADGTTTGISAADRAATAAALADPGVGAAAFKRPGHVFPLRYREGGVLVRPGHTEAAVDLARLAGRQPAGLLSEVVNEDGSMARLPDLLAFAEAHGLAIISIADLIKHVQRSNPIVQRVSAAQLPTRSGTFQAAVYRSTLDGIEHLAIVAGDVTGPEPVLVRVHSECLTGDVFGSLRCDCGTQLQQAMDAIGAAGRGVVVYLRGQEGRGIGLGHKLRAYALQEQGLDTVDANLELGLPVDSREYGTAAQILADLGVQSVRLLTNNPAKSSSLSAFGLEIQERVPLLTIPTRENERYLRSKQERMGHLLSIA